MSTNPWDANFTPAGIDQDLINAVTGAVAAGEQVVEQVVPAATPVISGATQAVESVLPSVVPTVTVGPVTSGGGSGGSGPSGSIPVTNVTGFGQTLEQVIEAAAKGSAKTALESLAPSIEAELAKEFQNVVGNVVARTTGGSTTASVPNLDDFIHADARSRAFRTLLIGLFVAVLTGLGTAASALAGDNLLTHTGQVAAASIALSAVVSSVVAYVGRLFHEPAVTRPLTAQLPPKVA